MKRIAFSMLALLCTPAMAEDFDWSGWYAGILGGGAGGTLLAHATNTEVEYPGGSQVGIGGGYDIVPGPVLFGLTADASVVNLAWTQNPFPGSSATISVENLVTLRARVGIPIDRVLPYVTAGAAIGTGHLEGTYPGGSDDVRALHFGLVAGLGVEALVTSNLSVGAEYLAVRLGDAGYQLSVGSQPSVVHHDLDLWRVKANWRF